MVIKLEFRSGQFWDDDHREGAPTLEYALDSKNEIRLLTLIKMKNLDSDLNSHTTKWLFLTKWPENDQKMNLS